jgi:hypothetical protein
MGSIPPPHEPAGRARLSQRAGQLPIFDAARFFNSRKRALNGMAAFAPPTRTSGLELLCFLRFLMFPSESFRLGERAGVRGTRRRTESLRLGRGRARLSPARPIKYRKLPAALANARRLLPLPKGEGWGEGERDRGQKDLLSDPADML